MSVSIYWQPTDNKWKRMGGTSSTVSALNFNLSKDGCLEEKDLEFLRGMFAAGEKEVEELIDAVVEHGKIRVRFEY